MAQGAGGTSDFAHSTRSYREDQFTLETSSVNLEELIPRFQPRLPYHSMPFRTTHPGKELQGPAGGQQSYPSYPFQEEVNVA